MNSSWENFLLAAQSLSAAGPIKNRLVEAYSSHLAAIRADDLPREVRDEFLALNDCLCAVRPLRGETTLQASVRKMSDNEASKHAQRILNLLGMLIRLQVQPRQTILRAVNGNED
ncbi:MAG: hypothetical protein H7Y02_02330 [Candidatus Obscuribacterales bacterium]|nr:hypothetical protein [Steroidobacteraceae bacterium]